MIRRLSACFFLCALLSACSGGGSTVPQSPANTAPGAGPSAEAQSVVVSIVVPAAPTTGSAAGRRALYVSTNTQSVAISVNGATPVITSLAPNSPNCTPVTGGRKCTVTVSAPVGNDTFAESMYASSNGTGSPLSQSTTSETIVAGKANTFTISLGGVVASIALTLADPTPPVGVPATIGLVVNLYDASHAAIVGSDPFINPVTLTDSDTSGVTTLSKTALNTPADATGLTVKYTGAALAQAVFSASAAGVATSSVSPAILTPSNSGSFVDWPTYAYDSQRTGFNPSSTAITPSSLSQLHLGWQIKSKGGSTTQPIVATNVGGHSAVVIIGNYDGVIAYDAVTGATVWQTTVGTQNLQTCGNASIAGTPVFDRSLGAIFIAGGNNSNPNHVRVFKLDVATGAVLNQVDVTPSLLNGEAVYGHTAVTMANGKLYVGTGSNCEGQVGGLLSWRGRVVEVDPNSMALTNTFFTTPTQGQNVVGGGGVWGWGGVSADSSGNIYMGAGNAETANTINGTPGPPFVFAQTEQDGYAEHLTKLTGDLAPLDSNYPGFNFQIGFLDLDYTGTPIIYQPPIGLGCGLLSATQGKGGTVVVNNTQNLAATPNIFKLSVPSAEANYIGNPGYSPSTGLLYAAIASSGQGSAMYAPGLAAIGGCGSTVQWHTQFGPDSTSYTSGTPAPRSAPTVTAGGVVFMGTPCTSNGNGGCGAPGTLNGAVWAVDATTGALLGTGGNPLLVTPDRVLMAPSVDGLWIYVLDMSGNLYGLTIDPGVHAIAQKSGQRVAQKFIIRSR